MIESLFQSKWIRPLFISNIIDKTSTSKVGRIFVVLYLLIFFIFMILLSIKIIGFTISEIGNNPIYIFSFIIPLIGYGSFRTIVGIIGAVGFTTYLYINHGNSTNQININIKNTIKTELSPLLSFIFWTSVSIYGAILVILIIAIIFEKSQPKKAEPIVRRAQTMQERLGVNDETRERMKNNLYKSKSENDLYSK